MTLVWANMYEYAVREMFSLLSAASLRRSSDNASFFGASATAFNRATPPFARMCAYLMRFASLIVIRLSAEVNDLEPDSAASAERVFDAAKS